MKRGTDSHASDTGHWLGMTTQKAGAGNGSDIGHWLGMTPLRGVRGDAPQGYLLRCVGIAPYVPSTESVCLSLRRFFSLDRLL